MAQITDRSGLVADLRRAGVLARTEILEEPHGFRLRPRGLNRDQIRHVRAALARVSAHYANVIVGNGALLPALELPPARR